MLNNQRVDVMTIQFSTGSYTHRFTDHKTPLSARFSAAKGVSLQNE
jgi:hypothetical protein